MPQTLFLGESARERRGRGRKQGRKMGIERITEIKDINKMDIR